MPSGGQRPLGESVACDVVVLAGYWRGCVRLVGVLVGVGQQRLAAVDATLSSGARSWRPRCGSPPTAGGLTAGPVAGPAGCSTWRCSTTYVVCDRKLAGARYQAPFDLLFNTGEFEYDAAVVPTGFEPALPP
jgi:hypothetical protein